MLKGVNCNLCKKNEVKIIYKSTIDANSDIGHGYNCTNTGHGIHYQIVKCKNCGLIYCSPRPNPETLTKGYTEAKDEIYCAELEGRIKTFQRNLKNITYYKKGGQLLDVGCSIGAFLYLAKQNGWEIEGIEPCSWNIEQAKKHFNIDIHKGTYEALTKFSKAFDVITLWDVLEHLDDPLDALLKCKFALKDDGILIFSTVNIGSLYARILGKRWPWLMKMHIYYFDRGTIKKYLDRAGFRILNCGIYKHIVSLDYIIYKLKKIDILIYLLIKAFKKYFLLDKTIFITFGLGDFIEVYATKN